MLLGTKLIGSQSSYLSFACDLVSLVPICKVQLVLVARALNMQPNVLATATWSLITLYELLEAPTRT